MKAEMISILIAFYLMHPGMQNLFTKQIIKHIQKIYQKMLKFDLILAFFQI